MKNDRYLSQPGNNNNFSLCFIPELTNVLYIFLFTGRKKSYSGQTMNILQIFFNFFSSKLGKFKNAANLRKFLAGEVVCNTHRKSLAEINLISSCASSWMIIYMVKSKVKKEVTNQNSIKFTFIRISVYEKVSHSYNSLVMRKPGFVANINVEDQSAHQLSLISSFIISSRERMIL